MLFFIHSEIGEKTRGVRVNNRLVPLSKVLKSGDQIEVITSENIKPTINWLDFVVTSRARSIIKSSINEQKKIRATEGKEILRRKLKSLKLNHNNKTISKMLEYFEFENVQDLYYRVAIGTVDNKKLKGFAKSYQNTLLNFFKRKVKKKEHLIEKDNDEFTERFDQIVFGKDKEQLAHSIANCCSPIPGDPFFRIFKKNVSSRVNLLIFF